MVTQIIAGVIVVLIASLIVRRQFKKYIKEVEDYLKDRPDK